MEGHPTFFDIIVTQTNGNSNVWTSTHNQSKQATYSRNTEHLVHYRDIPNASFSRTSAFKEIRYRKNPLPTTMVQFVEGSSDNQQEMDELNFAGRLQAHMELTTFLGLALGFVALILVLFLYVNKIRCFGSTPPFLSFDEHLISEKTFHRIRNRFAYDGNNSSDSEDESLRRLKLEPCIDSYTNSASCYHTNENILDHTPHFNSYNKILSAGKLTHSSQDLLAMAEGGKIGMPHSSNDCSSGSSIEVNLDYGTRLSLDAHVSNDRLANAESNSCIEGRIVETTDLKMRDNMLLPELTKESDQREVPIRKKSSKSSTSHRLESDSIGTCVASNETTVIDLKSKVLADESTPAAPVVDSYRQVSLTQQDSLEDVLSLNNDCILVFSHEPLYDTSDLKSLKSDGDAANAGFDGPSSASGSNGTLEISLLYDAPMRKMTVHVLQARGISSRGDKGQLTHTQVRLLMLPAKRQKHKTKIRSGENPQFMESFLLHRVNPEEVNSMGLRIRVYGCERMRRERLIGETIDTASTSDLLSIARSDSAGSTTSMQHGGVPELLLGLGYNGITGRLTVEIVKGSHFRNHSLPKVPDTYVKLCLVSSMGQEIARSKTSTRRGQSNPLFKETFIFQVALFQLNDVTLIVSIYAKRNMKRNEMVGWFSMGLNSSGPEEMIHWNEMRESSSRSELITRWHVLVDS